MSLLPLFIRRWLRNPKPYYLRPPNWSPTGPEDLTKFEYNLFIERGIDPKDYYTDLMNNGQCPECCSFDVASAAAPDRPESSQQRRCTKCNTRWVQPKQPSEEKKTK